MSIVQRKVREFLLEYIEGLDEYRLSDLVKAAREHFDHDASFRMLLFEETLAVLVPLEIRAIESQRRPPKGRGISWDRPASDLLRLMHESIGPGIRKSFIEMTRPEGLESFERRQRRNETEARFIAFGLDIYEGLPDDVTPVRAFYSDDQLQEKWDAHFGKVLA